MELSLEAALKKAIVLPTGYEGNLGIDLFAWMGQGVVYLHFPMVTGVTRVSLVDYHVVDFADGDCVELQTLHVDMGDGRVPSWRVTCGYSEVHDILFLLQVRD